MSSNTIDDRLCGAPTESGKPCRQVGTYADGRCGRHTERSTNPLRDAHRDLVEDATDDSQSTESRITSVLSRLTSRFPALMELSNIDSESDTAYNGPFSYGVEVHAFFFGVALGIWWAHDPATAINVIAGIIAVVFIGSEAGGKTKRVPNYIIRQARQEMHYFTGGIVAGALLLKHMHGHGEVSFVKIFRMLGLG